jgi:hypothetical protein
LNVDFREFEFVDVLKVFREKEQLKIRNIIKVLDDIVKRSNIKNGDINFFEFDEFAIDS